MRRLTNPSNEETEEFISSSTSNSSNDSINVQVRTPSRVIGMVRKLKLGRFVGEQSIAKLEDVDLEDRNGLIAMSELYNNKTSARDPNGIAGPGASHLQDLRLQNGTSTARGMSSRVDAANRPPGKEKKPGVIYVSKPQLFAALILAIAAILVAVLITYTVTRESMSRTGGTANASHGIATNYDDQFDVPEPPRPHQLPEVDPTSSNGTDHGVGPRPEELRLSQDLMPIWYNLSVKVYVPGFVPISQEKNLTFDGALIIKFRAVKATNRIELNAVDLHFPNKLDNFRLMQDGKRPKRDDSNVTDGQTLIVSSNGTKPVASIPNDDVSTETESIGAKSRVDSGIKVTGMQLNETLEKIVFTLDKELVQGQDYYFNIVYSGPISTGLSGLYLTTYTNADGLQRYAAVTQMEPTDARRFAPSFDEPQMKAIWRLKVIHPVGSRAVSNAIEIREDEPTSDKNWVLTSFEDSLPMSSYLLTMVVSDFEFVEGHTKNGVRLRIWARKEALNDTQYALQAGIKVLEFYEEYFKIPFPLAKQDMMAFPDFSAGAMEGWGLVTYREKFLLFNDHLYNSRQKAHVATVVAHELAHQWFGNLVTMKWWSDLWLNEGFATIMEYLGTDKISDGKFRMDEYFVIEALSSAMDRDARATSHPLYFEISKAEDVSEAFDAISYDKGASILRMVKSIMGEKAFKEGVTIYLNRFKLKNAEHRDLWNALNEAVPDSLTDYSGEKFDVNEFAKLWTKQMGFPVIEVKRLDDRKVELTQKRFKMDETALEDLRFRNAKYWYKWDVPLWYSINGTEKEMMWLHETSVLEVGEDETLIVNSDSKGFYRVQYSKKTLEKINEMLLTDHEKISSKSRARIIDDAFVLAQAGRIPYEAALNLTLYLKKETEYIPWYSAISGIDSIQFYFGDEPELADVREYIEAMISNLYEKITFDAFNTSYLDDNRFFENFLDVTIVAKMCQNRGVDCTDKLNTVYNKNFVAPCQNTKQQASQCSTVPVPLRGLTYCAGVRSGTERDWERMLELYERENVQIERDRLMTALTCSRDTHILKRLLSMTIDFNNTLIRLQDKPSIFESISGQESMGQTVTFEFFLDHWPQIYRDFKDQPTLLRSLIVGSIGGTSARTIEQLEKFLQENQATTHNLDVFKQRLEVMNTNRNWMEKNFENLSQWFKEQNKLRRSQQTAIAA
ncbi:Aminopeptidase N [Aphelenchoides besseyi]|nr:Aminopeptidase N [Aphelenchoides besseyi]